MVITISISCFVVFVSKPIRKSRLTHAEPTMKYHVEFLLDISYRFILYVFPFDLSIHKYIYIYFHRIRFTSLELLCLLSISIYIYSSTQFSYKTDDTVHNSY